MAQIKNHKEKKSRKSKARATLFVAVSPEIFVRIMTMKSAFDIWKFLKKEYEGGERIKGMHILNLIREFELQKMKDSETVKEYSDKLLSIAKKVRLLGSEFPDSRIVQKILVTVSERFEATISSLENTKDLSKVSLAELLNALQAQEQRRLLRSEGFVEGTLATRAQFSQGGKGKKNEKYKKENSANLKQKNGAQVADQKEEEQLFVASCFATSNLSDKWLVDSGCTNHMTFDRDLFKELDTSVVYKVRISNGEYIAVKGKGTVEIESSSGTKLIRDVLFVPNINQNLLSVVQLLEKGFKVILETNQYQIKDSEGKCVFKVKMKGKSFALDPSQEEKKAYSS
ncbi:uncharacterized protein LOC109838978 [Asparagus officinalis]|uniref:uncharacterized protein LOC109838978 n=1 Tax=Asparagus officinalis TaxID=4686 RepID=UPI00098E582A|nr:uncharacterized protein LOC109838978 [Asparagus officinalis]